ncbi:MULTISPECIES: hypothetical protein [Bacillus cereus group]|uniref:hypothetical protein n=1 Tax=Bacillus cereus group TaxID=86661 RepID=UPI00077292BC|nr:MULTISPECIES: hypothetical protein [Bacillus cereus group]KXI50280.1 hypothetical protein ACS95_13930 [Bacillus cereus]MDA2770831.1 hypothetical protein [Bacillus cereus group sp. Bc010]MED1446594.1 hypothetical protein [Bacillus pacificus]
MKKWPINTKQIARTLVVTLSLMASSTLITEASTLANTNENTKIENTQVFHEAEKVLTQNNLELAKEITNQAITKNPDGTISFDTKKAIKLGMNPLYAQETKNFFESLTPEQNELFENNEVEINVQNSNVQYIPIVIPFAIPAIAGLYEVVVGLAMAGALYIGKKFVDAILKWGVVEACKKFQNSNKLIKSFCKANGYIK